MKISRRITTLVLAMVLSIGALSITASAAGTTMYGIGFVDASSLRLRSEPSTSSKTLDYAPRNECVVVISKSGNWYKVNYNLQVGYMHADYLNVKTRRNAELGYGKITGSAVNMRSGPSTSNKVITVSSKGDKCYIIGLNEGWYKVIYNGSIGYIRSDYVQLTEIPYENQDSDNSPKFFRQGNSTGVAPSAAALSGSTASDSDDSGWEPDYDGSLWGDSDGSDQDTDTDSSSDMNWNNGSENSGSSPDSDEDDSWNGGASTDGSTSEGSATGQQILAEAKKYLGTPYVYGGASPSGFDCSGFVYYVLKQVGYSPYRTPADQYNMGTYVEKSDLQPGDIVFFAGTYASGISHVGIYAGNGQFIHSPNSRSPVSYSDLTSGYWANHYYGARRMG